MSIFVGVPWLIIMALEQEFENALKDVVSSKRASVSKMTRLSEAAKRCFEVCFASSMAIPKRNPISAHPLPLGDLPTEPPVDFLTHRTTRKWCPCYTVHTCLCNLSIRCLVCTHLTRWHVLLAVIPSSTGALVRPSRATAPPSCLNWRLSWRAYFRT
jgi:hypothetical protein